MHTPVATNIRSRGFTLVELLIVMVIVAILSAIAIPSYRQHVLKVKRADAQTALTGWAQRLERCYTRYNRYTGFPASDLVCTFTTADTADGTYRITLDTPSAQTFTLTATPLGYQLEDTRCNVMTINQAGQQTASGTDGNTKCW
ncbi:MAG: type IV pilin protein [Steroidobacteraceae bacterium]